MIKRFFLMLAVGMFSHAVTHAYVMYYDTLSSTELGRDVQVAVMAPLEYRVNLDKHYPVLYALHGQSANGGNYTFWNNQQMKSTIHAGKQMLVVMFKNDMSLYAAETDFFFNELIPYVDTEYRTLTNGANRAITGFSSGGFGCLHYALYAPEKFSSVIPMSGAVAYTDGGYDVIDRFKDSIDVRDDVPPVAVFCGTEDFLYQSNLDFVDSLTAWGHEHEATYAAGGHTGTYWEATCPGIVNYAWEHFDTSQTTAVREPVLLQPAAALHDDVTYYDCLGRKVRSDAAGILIGTDGKAVVKRLRIR